MTGCTPNRSSREVIRSNERQGILYVDSTSFESFDILARRHCSGPYSIDASTFARADEVESVIAEVDDGVASARLKDDSILNRIDGTAY